MEKYTIKLILLLMKYYNFNILQFFLNLFNKYYELII